MDPASDRSSAVARAIIAATLVVALAPSFIGRAQDASPEAAPVDAASVAADQQLSRRERRRAAEAAAAAEAAQAQGVAELAPTTVAAVAPGEAESAVAAEDELVCKKYKLTGTKIAKRVCGTQAQWDARNRRTSEAAQDAVREVGEQSAFPAAPTVPTAPTGVGLSL